MQRQTHRSCALSGIVPRKVPPRRRYLDTFSSIILALDTD